MTIRDDSRPRTLSDSDDRIDVSPGVPTDRVRWGAILAGTFAALTALAILGTLGAAIGLSSFDRGEDSPRNFAIGAGIWGLISTILAFGFGGWLTARVAALHGRDNGLLNGMMVAAFGLPLLMFVLGSASGMIGASVANNDPAAPSRMNAGTGMPGSDTMAASARVGDNQGTAGGMANNPNDSQEQARKVGSRTAWGTLIAMLLSLGAASAGGYLGARSRDHDGDRLSHSRARGVDHSGASM